MRVIYTGPHGAVDVPSLGLTAEAGEPVDVPDDIGAGLVAREDWAKARTTTESEG